MSRFKNKVKTSSTKTDKIIGLTKEYEVEKNEKKNDLEFGTKMTNN